MVHMFPILEKYIIKGNVTIRDMNREFDWNLPDNNASTLAGLIFCNSG